MGTARRFLMFRLMSAITAGALVALALSASAYAAETVHVCGALQAYRPVTPTAPGTPTIGGHQSQPGIITVAGQSFAIVEETNLSGDPLKPIGSQVCLDGTWTPSDIITPGRILNTGTLTGAPASTAAPRAAPPAGTLPNTSTSGGDLTGFLLLGGLVVLGGLGLAASTRRRTGPLR
jgi:hypothetical protein